MPLLTHPVPALKRIGINDDRVFIAIVLLISLSVIPALYRVIAYLSFLEENLILTTREVVVINGGAVLLLASVLGWYARNLRRGLQDPARQGLSMLQNQKFAGLLDEVKALCARIGLQADIQFHYNPFENDVNAQVFKKRSTFYVNVSRGLWKLYQRDKAVCLSIIAHELSHVELNDIRFSNLFRWCLNAYLIVFAWLLAYVLFILNLDKFFGEWAWEMPLTSVFGPMLMSLSGLLGAYIYSYYFLIQRELIHDIRAIQIMEDAEGLITWFKGVSVATTYRSIAARTRHLLLYFFGYHPFPKARLVAVSEKHPYLINYYIFPFVSGVLVLVVPQLVRIILQDFDLLSPALDAAISLVLPTLLTYLLLQSDFGRLGMLMLKRKLRLLPATLYIFLLTLGSFAAVFPVIIARYVGQGFDREKFAAAVEHALDAAAGSLVVYLVYFMALPYLNALTIFAERKSRLALRAARTVYWVTCRRF